MIKSPGSGRNLARAAGLCFLFTGGKSEPALQPVLHYSSFSSLYRPARLWIILEIFTPFINCHYALAAVRRVCVAEVWSCDGGVCRLRRCGTRGPHGAGDGDPLPRWSASPAAARVEGETRSSGERWLCHRGLCAYTRRKRVESAREEAEVGPRWSCAGTVLSTRAGHRARVSLALMALLAITHHDLTVDISFYVYICCLCSLAERARAKLSGTRTGAHAGLVTAAAKLPRVQYKHV